MKSITITTAALAFAIAATITSQAQTPGSVTISIPAGTTEILVAPVPVADYFSDSRMEALTGLTDTIDTRGRQTVTVPVADEPLAVMVANPAESSRYFTVFAGPGETITLDLDSPYGAMTGSTLAEGITDWLITADSIMSAFSALPPTASEEERQAMARDYNDRALALSLANADNAFGLFMISQIQDEASMLRAFDALGRGAKESIIAPFYDSVAGYVGSRRAAISAAENIKEGKPAPDFTLPDPEGNPVSLSSFLGKWVMLDFWGSWCGWCIKGIPQMKSQWDELKDRNVVFISIDCQEDRAVWLNALERYDLPWVNLWSDPETPQSDAVQTRYGVKGYPTKLVIDPEGKISFITIGEDPTFYDRLRSLLPDA